MVNKCKKIIIMATIGLLSGCLGMPHSVKPVDDFAIDKYLGKWYEIARLDHSFERGLTDISASYTLRDDGGISVTNRGFSVKEQQWQEAQGKAYFVERADLGYLKVSFFGPFYGSYVVFGLEKQNYQYAFVSGPDTSYLWLLSRTPEVSSEIKALFIDQAKQRGFATEQLIFVEHHK